MIRFVSRVMVVGALLVFGGATSAYAMTKCHLTYDLKGWSVFYKTARGTGHVTCANGQEAKVNITAHGGGLTFGRSRVIGGKGSFTGVQDIDGIYGTYGEASAHAGAGASTDARVMFKDNVRLRLSGTGQGFNLGFALGSFKITPR